MIAILWCSLVLGNAVTDGRGLFDGGVFDKDESVDGGSPSRTFSKFKTGTSRVGISRATEATGLPLPMTLIGGLNGCGENKTGNLTTTAKIYIIYKLMISFTIFPRIIGLTLFNC